MILKIKSAIFAVLSLFAISAFSQDGTIYPLEDPSEPNAIPLNTGGWTTNQQQKFGLDSGRTLWQEISHGKSRSMADFKRL